MKEESHRKNMKTVPKEMMRKEIQSREIEKFHYRNGLKQIVSVCLGCVNGIQIFFSNSF